MFLKQKHLTTKRQTRMFFYAVFPDYASSEQCLRESSTCTELRSGLECAAQKTRGTRVLHSESLTYLQLTPKVFFIQSVYLSFTGGRVRENSFSRI